MHLQSCLLSAAILAALAVSAPASAARPDLAPAASRAQGLIDASPASIKRNAADGFVAKGVNVDADGTEHVRFNRTYRGLPVIGGDFVVHSRNGQLKGTSLTLKSSARPDLSGKISADEATIVAGADFGTDFTGMKGAHKVVFARNTTPKLAYEVVFTGTKRDQTPTEMHYFVDANSGAILDKWDMVHTAKPGGGTGGSTPAVGTGRTLQYGNVSINTAGSNGTFNLTDTTRGGGATYDALNRTYPTAA